MLCCGIFTFGNRLRMLTISDTIHIYILVCYTIYILLFHDMTTNQYAVTQGAFLDLFPHLYKRAGSHSRYHHTGSIFVWSRPD